jgi:hypothetical protein
VLLGRNLLFPSGFAANGRRGEQSSLVKGFSGSRDTLPATPWPPMLRKTTTDESCQNQEGRQHYGKRQAHFHQNRFSASNVYFEMENKVLLDNNL